MPDVEAPFTTLVSTVVLTEIRNQSATRINAVAAATRLSLLLLKKKDPPIRRMSGTRCAQFVVTFDADGQHRASDIPLLISALVDTGADIACGSRFLGRAVNLPKSRRALLKMAVAFTYLTTGMRMTDAHNGLRAMTRGCAMRIRIRQNRMAHASEIVTEIARLKLKFVEVPVTICYSPYSLHKGQKVGNSLNIIVDLVVRKLHR